MKTLLQTLFFFLLVTQICFAQVYQQNREASPYIKNSQLDQQDKHFPIIDWKIQGKSSHEFSILKIPDTFGSGNDNLDVNGTSYPFLNDRFIPNVYKTNFPPTNKMLFPLSQFYVIDTAIVISERKSLY